MQQLNQPAVIRDAHTHTLSTDALNMQIVLMTAYIFVRKCTPINMQSKCRAAAHRGNEEQTCCYHWVQLIATESWLFRGHSIEIGVFAALPRTCLIPHVTKSVLCLPHLDFFFFSKVGKDTRARIPHLHPWYPGDKFRKCPWEGLI